MREKLPLKKRMVKTEKIMEKGVEWVGHTTTTHLTFLILFVTKKNFPIFVINL
jgi:hypothetical protein